MITCILFHPTFPLGLICDPDPVKLAIFIPGSCRAERAPPEGAAAQQDPWPLSRSLCSRGLGASLGDPRGLPRLRGELPGLRARRKQLIPV